MNNRHIQTFLTVSAAFFAMSAPLHSNASVKTQEDAYRCATQHVFPKRSDDRAQATTRSEQDA